MIRSKNDQGLRQSRQSVSVTAAQEARSPDSRSAIRPHPTSSTGPSSRAPPPPQPAIPGVCGIRLDCSSVLFSQSDVLADTELGKGGRGSFSPLLASSTTTAGVQEGGGPTHIARCSGVGRGQRRGASVQRQACRPAVSEEGCSGGTRIRSAFRTHHSAYGEKGGVKVLSRSPEEWPGAKAPIPEGGAGCWYERWTAQPGSGQLRSKSERRHYHPDILLWLTGGPGQRHWSGELLGCRCCAGSPQAHLRLKFQS